MVEAEKDSPKQEGEKQPWRELVPSFSGTSAGVYEALGNFQAEYGFKHGYESDSDSLRIETESTVTQFELQHEDDLEEMHSMQPSNHQALKEITNCQEKGMLPCYGMLCLSSFKPRYSIVTSISPSLPDYGRSPAQNLSVDQVHLTLTNTEIGKFPKCSSS